jgi:hypothetical protein
MSPPCAKSRHWPRPPAHDLRRLFDGAFPNAGHRALASSRRLSAISWFPMAHRSVTVRKKKRGPPAAAKGTLIGLRLEPGALARVDRWAASQQDDPSRSEAIRRLVELGLASAQRARARTKTAAKAAEMASEEIDRLGDLSASDEERRLRKRRLIRGPKEFRDLRRNRPKANE